jgi:hypothetical protein
MSYSIQIKKALLTKNDSFKVWDTETLLDFDDEKHFDVSYLEFVNNEKLYNQNITKSHQASSAEHRQQARSRLAELEGVNSSSIPYPRSNIQLAEYKKEIQHLEEKLVFYQINSAKQVQYPRSSFKLLGYNNIEEKSRSHQARSAELRQQVRERLAELKGVDPGSIPYPRSNIKLTEYENEILRLEIVKQEFQEKLQLEKLAKRLKELKEENSYNSLKNHGIEDNRIILKTSYKFSNDNKEQNHIRADNLKTAVSDIDETKHCRKITTKSNVKNRKLIENTHLGNYFLYIVKEIFFFCLSNVTISNI